MISFDALTLGYGSHILLDRISATLERGELIALLGRNGTGKSTLLRAIAGLGKISRGKILLGGQVVGSLSPDQAARIVSLVTTDKIQVPHLTCKEVVALGRSPYTNWIGKMQKRDEEMICHALDTVGMAAYAGKTVERLSDGECQRIMIARALAQDTPIILLDEPTSFLDLPNRYELGMLLRNLAHEQNKCVLFSTHELDIALTLSDAIALIENPALHYSSTQVMIGSGHIERLFQSETIAFDAQTQRVLLKR